MLRELNENEMMMVSGADSPPDEVVVTGTYTPDTPPPSGSIPSGGGGNGGGSFSVTASDGTVFTGALAAEQAAIHEANLRAMAPAPSPTNPETTVPDPGGFERFACSFGNNSACTALRADRYNHAGQPDPQRR